MISRRSESGVALVMALMILLVLGILVPSLILLQQKDVKDTVSSGRKTTSLQLAEAGQDRAAWKLRESDETFADAAAGTNLAGYNDDQTYTDVNGGQYKVNINPGPGVSQVTVIAKGKADGADDVRAIQAIYSKGSTIGAMSVNGALQYKPNLNIEWGPVVTFSNITQTPANRYPRKFASGSITGRDTANDSMNGALPSGNWADYDYVAFYDLGTAPTINLAHYLNKAKNSLVQPILKKGSGNGNASPWSDGGFPSGYYPATAQGGSSGNANGVKMEKGSGGGNFDFECATCTIYIEGEVKRWPSGTWVDAEAVIVTGDLDFNGGGHPYSVEIPDAAEEEYLFEPDGVNYWNSKGWNGGDTITLTDMGYHGFMYVGGDVGNAGGGANMVGAIFVNGEVTTNTMSVYYDAAVTTGIKMSNSQIIRMSWDEVRVPW